MKPESLTIQPPLDEWADLARRSPDGLLLGRSQSDWRELTRRELNLASDRRIIATGHQTLLWHPGILAKYLAMDTCAKANGFSTANLIVDQHVGNFGELNIPIRRNDGSLSVLKHNLTKAIHPDVPMALHKPFVPAQPPLDTAYALDCVREGIDRIVTAINAHRNAPNAAIQMARTLTDLMQRWAAPATDVPATALCATSLARAFMQHMVEKPGQCVEAYNRAVAAVFEAGIPPLATHGDDVEMPLWRIGNDGMRVRANVANLNNSPSLERGGWGMGEAVTNKEAQTAPLTSSLTGKGNQLMPRALFMTALVRLGMCDLFIHGTGGAAYDRAMELWIRDWLGVEVAPKAVITADVRLPLSESADERTDVEASRHAARHIWHDPPSTEDPHLPSQAKQTLLQRINQLPSNSPERKQAFHIMHRKLEQLRQDYRAAIEAASADAERAMRQARDADIARRRDWAFPLYPQSSIDELAETIRNPARFPHAPQHV